MGEKKGFKVIIKKVFKGALALGLAAGLTFGAIYVDDTYFDNTNNEQNVELENEINILNAQIAEKNEQLVQLEQAKNELQETLDKKIEEYEQVIEMLKQEESSNGITLEQSNLQLRLVSISEKISQQVEFSKEDRIAVENEFDEITSRLTILVYANQISDNNFQVMSKAINSMKEIYAIKNIEFALENVFSSEAIEFSENVSTINANGIKMDAVYTGICDKLYSYSLSKDKAVMEGFGQSIGAENYRENTYLSDDALAEGAKSNFIKDMKKKMMDFAQNDAKSITYEEENDVYLIEYRLQDGTTRTIECNIDDEKLVSLKISHISQLNPYSYYYTFKEMSKEEFDQKYDEILQEIEEENAMQ